MTSKKNRLSKGGFLTIARGYYFKVSISVPFLTEVLMHLAQTLIFCPSTTLLWILILCVLFVAMLEWLRDWLEVVPRPQT